MLRHRSDQPAPPQVERHGITIGHRHGLCRQSRVAPGIVGPLLSSLGLAQRLGLGQLSGHVGALSRRHPVSPLRSPNR